MDQAKLVDKRVNNKDQVKENICRKRDLSYQCKKRFELILRIDVMHPLPDLTHLLHNIQLDIGGRKKIAASIMIVILL